MKKDIGYIEDIKQLVDCFYLKVRKDNVIGYIFNDVAKVNWEEHLPRMYSFWETLLFGKISFKGNPMIRHLVLSEKVHLTEAHFDRWVQLWCETIDELFTGETAKNAKSKAMTMKMFMFDKIQKKYNELTEKNLHAA